MYWDICLLKQATVAIWPHLKLKLFGISVINIITEMLMLIDAKMPNSLSFTMGNSQYLWKLNDYPPPKRKELLGLESEWCACKSWSGLLRVSANSGSSWWWWGWYPVSRFEPTTPASCSFLTCFLRSKFRQKPLWQMRQVKGFCSLWVCMWKVKL